MEKPVILLATPCYGGMMAEPYVRSLVGLALMFPQKAAGWGFYTSRSESLVQRARNAAAAECMAGPYTHLMFIDADVEFRPDDVFRLVDHGVDVVAGAYPVKRLDTDPERVSRAAARPGPITEHLTDFPFNLDPEEAAAGVEMTEAGLLSVSEAPTGFMLIRRRVLEALRDARPESAYEGGWAIFEPFIDPKSRQYLSEDYAFCRRWKQLGGKVWVDLGVKLGHHGQMVYRGDPMAWVASAGGRS